MGHSIERTTDSPFIYRQIFFSQILDDEVLVLIFRAIRDKRSVVLNIVNTKSSREEKNSVIPLMILSNARTGRRYIGIFSLRKNKFSTLRLDYVKDVEFGGIYPGYDVIRDKYRALMKYSFSIMNKTSEGLKSLRVLLSIDENSEQYVIGRIKREGRHGVLNRVMDNVFEYTIDVPDTLEMVPWLRTFIGRIIEIDGTEAWVISQFKKDIETMMSMYMD
jgi:predicted DNA-binding transcriptional regulator YafY